MCSKHLETLAFKKMDDACEHRIISANSPAEQGRQIEERPQINTQIFPLWAANCPDYNKIGTVFLLCDVEDAADMTEIDPVVRILFYSRIGGSAQPEYMQRTSVFSCRFRDGKGNLTATSDN